jgi:hypothetical protein
MKKYPINKVLFEKLAGIKNSVNLSVFKYILLFFLIVPVLHSQGARDNSGSNTALPLTKVVILTSGIAYFEHSGNVNGNVSVNLPFKYETVNDALKSLIIKDTASPQVIYQSENALYQILRSLKVDLSDEPGFARILSKLKGAEVEVTSSSVITGRILGVEYRAVSNSPFAQINEPWLLIASSKGLQAVNLNGIISLGFRDKSIENDLSRALDLLASSGNSTIRNLLINLPENGARNVSISYVIPSPVWKVSYRLDMDAEKPLFQAWAIVDNDSGIDWNNVELSLVAGRPSSFIYNLYPPYYVYRPVLAPAIAGNVQAQAYDQAYDFAGAEGQSKMAIVANDSSVTMELSRARAPLPEPAFGNLEAAAAGSGSGDQFEFTIKKPVNLDRYMSTMLPLAQTAIEGSKLLVYSSGQKSTHPRLGARLENNSDMKFPAGPVTVYDGGVYAGDALIEFWNQNEKRLISYGEDLSVSAFTGDTNARSVSSVKISGGVMTINRSLTFIKTYTFLNTGAESKNLVIEHPRTAQTTLASPDADEQTQSLYRFNTLLPPGKELVFSVREERPLSETISLLSIRNENFLSYASNQEIPAAVRGALQRAIELKRAADSAKDIVSGLEAQKSRLVSDQDRIRRNLEAAGSQSPEGQEYLKRLVSLDNEIDSIDTRLVQSRENEKSAGKVWEDYLNNLDF